MKVVIIGNSKEIADLVVGIQSQQNDSFSPSNALKSVIHEVLHGATCDIGEEKRC